MNNMSDSKETKEIAVKTDAFVVPEGSFPYEVMKAVKDAEKPMPQRGLVFETEMQRNAQFLKKGLTKPGRISYDTLRRSALSVHIVRICINVLKEKITKTKWIVQPVDPLKRKSKGKPDERINEVVSLFNHPNSNDETFRTLLDKILEDLLVLDAVAIEKTRFPTGELAELHFVDAATIRPVFDEYGNQDVMIPLDTKREGEEDLPVSYLQVLNNSQYGGPESGDIVAAWPKKDFIYFHMHPQGSMEGFGYGLSPIEGILSVVANILNADNYNSTYFEEGSFPPILLHFTGNSTARDLNALREYLYQELTGNFHRPAVTTGATKPEVIDLKADSNRDMQFMEYQDWLARLCAAAFGLAAQDIGITDKMNRATSEVQADLSDSKGYSSILELLKEVFNQQIIWKDFGYLDLEFDWVNDDTMKKDEASVMYDRDLKNGTRTMNEIRQKIGETPYGAWADVPTILVDGKFIPIAPPEEDSESLEQEEVVIGEKPYEDQDTEGLEGTEADKSMRKAVYTPSNFKVWADDRGYSQPFIFQDIKAGTGMVIKPPVAVNMQSQALEQTLTAELQSMGLNVRPVTKMTYVEVLNMLRDKVEVLVEFEKYCSMTAEYDSEKWRSKHGGSRKFSYYLVSDYVEGFSLNNPLLIADMKRDPKSYERAVRDLARLWEAERDLVLGDRRADQYLITTGKRAYGIDYQFAGDKARWEKNKDAIPTALGAIPELREIFVDETATQKSFFGKIKKRFRPV